MSVEQLAETRPFRPRHAWSVGHRRVASDRAAVDETEVAPQVSELLGAVDARFATRTSACLALVARADDAVVARLERALPAGPVAFDVELHRAVGNPVVCELAAVAREAWRRCCEHAAIDAAGSQHRADDQAVVEALRARDREEILRLLTEHRLAVLDRVRGGNG